MNEKQRKILEESYKRRGIATAKNINTSSVIDAIKPASNTVLKNKYDNKTNKTSPSVVNKKPVKPKPMYEQVQDLGNQIVNSPKLTSEQKQEQLNKLYSWDKQRIENEDKQYFEDKLNKVENFQAKHPFVNMAGDLTGVNSVFIDPLKIDYQAGMEGGSSFWENMTPAEKIVHKRKQAFSGALGGFNAGLTVATGGVAGGATGGVAGGAAKAIQATTKAGKAVNNAQKSLNATKNLMNINKTRSPEILEQLAKSLPSKQQALTNAEANGFYKAQKGSLTAGTLGLGYGGSSSLNQYQQGNISGKEAIENTARTAATFATVGALAPSVALGVNKTAQLTKAVPTIIKGLASNATEQAISRAEAGGFEATKAMIDKAIADNSQKQLPVLGKMLENGLKGIAQTTIDNQVMVNTDYALKNAGNLLSYEQPTDYIEQQKEYLPFSFLGGLNAVTPLMPYAKRGIDGAVKSTVESNPKTANMFANLYDLFGSKAPGQAGRVQELNSYLKQLAQTRDKDLWQYEQQFGDIVSDNLSQAENDMAINSFRKDEPIKYNKGEEVKYTVPEKDIKDYTEKDYDQLAGFMAQQGASLEEIDANIARMKAEAANERLYENYPEIKSKVNQENDVKDVNTIRQYLREQGYTDKDIDRFFVEKYIKQGDVQQNNNAIEMLDINAIEKKTRDDIDEFLNWFEKKKQPQPKIKTENNINNEIDNQLQDGSIGSKSNENTQIDINTQNEQEIVSKGATSYNGKTKPITKGDLKNIGNQIGKPSTENKINNELYTIEDANNEIKAYRDAYKKRHPKLSDNLIDADIQDAVDRIKSKIGKPKPAEGSDFLYRNNNEQTDIYDNVVKEEQVNRAENFDKEHFDVTDKILKHFEIQEDPRKNTYTLINRTTQRPMSGEFKAKLQEFFDEYRDIPYDEKMLERIFEEEEKLEPIKNEDTLKYQEGIEAKPENTNPAKYIVEDKDFIDFYEKYKSTLKNGETTNGSVSLIKKKLLEMRKNNASEKDMNKFFKDIQRQQEHDKKSHTAKKPGEKNVEFDDLSIEKSLTEAVKELDEDYLKAEQAPEEEYLPTNEDKAKGVTLVNKFIENFVNRVYGKENNNKKAAVDLKYKYKTIVENENGRIIDTDINIDNFKNFEEGIDAYLKDTFTQNTGRVYEKQKIYSDLIKSIEDTKYNDRVKQYAVDYINNYLKENEINYIQPQTISAKQRRTTAIKELKKAIMDYPDLAKQAEEKYDYFREVLDKNKGIFSTEVKKAYKDYINADRNAFSTLNKAGRIIKDNYIGKKNSATLKHWQQLGEDIPQRIDTLIKKGKLIQAWDMINKYDKVMTIGAINEIGGKGITEFNDIYNNGKRTGGVEVVEGNKTWNSEDVSQGEGARLIAEQTEKFKNRIAKKFALKKYDKDWMQHVGDGVEYEDLIRRVDDIRINSKINKVPLEEEIEGHGKQVFSMGEERANEELNKTDNERRIAYQDENGNIFIDTQSVREHEIDTVKNIIKRRKENGAENPSIGIKWKDEEAVYQYLENQVKPNRNINLTVKSLVNDHKLAKELVDMGKGHYEIFITNKKTHKNSLGGFIPSEESFKFYRTKDMTPEVISEAIDHEFKHARDYSPETKPLFDDLLEKTNQYKDVRNKYGDELIGNILTFVDNLKQGIRKSDKTLTKSDVDKLFGNISNKQVSRRPKKKDYIYKEEGDNFAVFHKAEYKQAMEDWKTRTQNIVSNKDRILKNKLDERIQELENIKQFFERNPEAGDLYKELRDAESSYVNHIVEESANDPFGLTLKERLDKLKTTNPEKAGEYERIIEQAKQKQGTERPADKGDINGYNNNDSRGVGKTEKSEVLPGRSKQQQRIEEILQNDEIELKEYYELLDLQNEQNNVVEKLDTKTFDDVERRFSNVTLDDLHKVKGVTQKAKLQAENLDKRRRNLWGENKQFNNRQKMLETKRYAPQYVEKENKNVPMEERTEYNYERGEKVGVTGKSSYGWKVNDWENLKRNLAVEEIKTTALENIDKLVKEHFSVEANKNIAPEQAKEIRNRVPLGHVPYNREVLNQAIYSGMTKDMYKLLLSGKDLKTILKDSPNLSWYEDLRKRSTGTKIDGYIPEYILDKLLQNGRELPTQITERYGKVAGTKAFSKAFTRFADDMFKHTVLPTYTFLVNNPITGDPMMHLASAKNPLRFIKNYADALKLNPKDVPPEVLDGFIQDVQRSKTPYTGVKGVDNYFNLMLGETIKDVDLVKIQKEALDAKGNKFIKEEVTKKRDLGKFATNWSIGLVPRAYGKMAKSIMNVNSKLSNLNRKAVFVNAVKERILDKTKFNKTVRQAVGLQEAVKYLKHSREMEGAVINDINNVLGDYINFSPIERKLFKSVVPFYSWERTILRNTAYMAVKNPGRLALIKLFLAKRKAEDEDMMEWQRGANKTGLVSRNGNDVLWNKWEHIPWNTNMDILDDLYGAGKLYMSGNSKDTYKANKKLGDAGNKLLGKVNPLLKIGTEFALGKKAFANGKISSNKYSYNSKTGKYKNNKTGEVHDYTPLDLRARYAGTQLARSYGGALGNSMVSPEKWLYAIQNEGELPDKLADDMLFDYIDKKDGLTKIQKYINSVVGSMQPEYKNKRK